MRGGRVASEEKKRGGRRLIILNPDFQFFRNNYLSEGRGERGDWGGKKKRRKKVGGKKETLREEKETH